MSKTSYFTMIGFAALVMIGAFGPILEARYVDDPFWNFAISGWGRDADRASYFAFVTGAFALSMTVLYRDERVLPFLLLVVAGFATLWTYIGAIQSLRETLQDSDSQNEFVIEIGWGSVAALTGALGLAIFTVLWILTRLFSPDLEALPSDLEG